MHQIKIAEKFHEKNPEVYDLFKSFTFKVINKGYKNIGAQMIIERIRWETMIETIGSRYKINNNLAAFYSRLFVKDNPSYTGIFRQRKSYYDTLN